MTGEADFDNLGPVAFLWQRCYRPITNGRIALTSIARKTTQVTPDTEGWITLPSAAKELGVTRHTVLKAVVKGELVADHRGEWVFIDRASLETYKERRAAAKKSATRKVKK